MQVLMLGWEFPPKVTGGLAIATAGLVKALDQAGHRIVLMLPERQMPPPSAWTQNEATDAAGTSATTDRTPEPDAALTGPVDAPASEPPHPLTAAANLSGPRTSDHQAAPEHRQGSGRSLPPTQISAGISANKSVAASATDDDDEPRPWPIPPHPLLAVARAWQRSGATAEPLAPPQASNPGLAPLSKSGIADQPPVEPTLPDHPQTEVEPHSRQVPEAAPKPSANSEPEVAAEHDIAPPPAPADNGGGNHPDAHDEAHVDVPEHYPEFTPPVRPDPEDQRFGRLPGLRALPAHAAAALQSLPVIVPDPYSSHVPSFEPATETAVCDGHSEARAEPVHDPLKPIGYLGGLVVGDSRFQLPEAPAQWTPAGEPWAKQARQGLSAGDADRLVEEHDGAVQPSGVSHGVDGAAQDGESSGGEAVGRGRGSGQPVEPPLPPGVSRLRWLPGDQTSYEGDLFKAVAAYAVGAVEAARHESFEVIHAHDWLTMPAATALAAIHSCPMVLHVHSTEYDRSPDGPDPRIVAIERRGMLAADRVIAVSHQTRQTLIKRYGVPAKRIVVVHNALDAPAAGGREPRIRFEPADRLVTFIGRITSQKGPQFFVEAARRVLAKERGVKFVMAGTGDLVVDMIERVAREGMGGRFVFTGFLSQQEVGQLLDRSDVFVLTSVHEPFGLTPLEAARRQVPVIVSRKAGVSEVLKHTLKVDHWNPEDIADKVLAVLRRPALAATMRHEAELEVRRLTWDQAAARCTRLYRDLLRKPAYTPA